jgi:hypothetical protein
MRHICAGLRVAGEDGVPAGAGEPHPQIQITGTAQTSVDSVR